VKRWLLTLFALLLMIPSVALAAGSAVILGIDDANLYDGMTKPKSRVHANRGQRGCDIVLPLVTTGSISGSTIVATPNLGTVGSAPFVFGNYQKTVSLGTQPLTTGRVRQPAIMFDLI
jgi:ABC-type Fe3+ transport system permease subunit